MVPLRCGVVLGAPFFPNMVSTIFVILPSSCLQFLAFPPHFRVLEKDSFKECAKFKSQNQPLQRLCVCFECLQIDATTMSLG